MSSSKRQQKASSVASCQDESFQKAEDAVPGSKNMSCQQRSCARQMITLNIKQHLGLSRKNRSQARCRVPGSGFLSKGGCQLAALRMDKLDLLQGPLPIYRLRGTRNMKWELCCEVSILPPFVKVAARACISAFFAKVAKQRCEGKTGTH